MKNLKGWINLHLGVFFCTLKGNILFFKDKPSTPGKPSLTADNWGLNDVKHDQDGTLSHRKTDFLVEYVREREQRVKVACAATFQQTLAWIGLIALLFAILGCTPAQAQTMQCGKRSEIIEALSAKYGEVRVVYGLSQETFVFELFASLDSGTWSLLKSYPNGASCLMAHGEDFSFDTARHTIGEKET